MMTKSSATINAGNLDTLIRAHKPHPGLSEVLDAVRRHNDRFAEDASTLDMIKRLRPHPDAGAINAVIRRATVRNRVFVTTLREIETLALPEGRELNEQFEQVLQSATARSVCLRPKRVPDAA